jgi:hypothetical protein
MTEEQKQQRSTSGMRNSNVNDIGSEGPSDNVERQINEMSEKSNSENNNSQSDNSALPFNESQV